MTVDPLLRECITKPLLNSNVNPIRKLPRVCPAAKNLLSLLIVSSVLLPFILLLFSSFFSHIYLREQEERKAV
jgi:hypothetical protein